MPIKDVTHETLLQYASEGNFHKYIAEIFDIKGNDYNKLWGRVLRWLGVETDEEAMVVAIERGLIEGPRIARDRFEQLLPEQIKLIVLICAGNTGKSISKKLGISEGAADKRIRKLCTKLGASNKVHLAAAYTVYRCS